MCKGQQTQATGIARTCAENTNLLLSDGAQMAANHSTKLWYPRVKCRYYHPLPKNWFPWDLVEHFFTHYRIVQNLRAVPQIWWHQIHLIFFSSCEFPFSPSHWFPRMRIIISLWGCFSKFIKESTCWLCRCHTQNGFLLLQLLEFSLFFLNFE